MRAPLSTLEQLDSLLEERAKRTRQWRERLPALRAKTLATGIMLDEFARTSPAGRRPRRKDVEVMLAAPDSAWVDDLKSRLLDALPGTRIELDSAVERVQEAKRPMPVNWLVRGVPGSNASSIVHAALEQMRDLDVDYSRSLDLIVVSPRS